MKTHLLQGCKMTLTFELCVTLIDRIRYTLQSQVVRCLYEVW